MVVKVLYHAGVMSLYPDGRVEFSSDPRDSIIRSLSRECRWGGHTDSFLSVAEHSINVANRVYAVTENAFFALQGLWHDCAEGLGVRDIASELKHVWGKKLGKASDHITEHVFGILGLPYPPDPIVKTVDTEYGIIEGAALVPSFSMRDKQMPNYNHRLSCWSPDKAESEFRKCHRHFLSILKPVHQSI